MPRQELPFDVYHSIMQMMSDIGDVSRLGRTCRSISHAAAGELLRGRSSRGVALTKGTHCSSFASFISRDNRASLLRRLDLSMVRELLAQDVVSDTQWLGYVANILGTCPLVSELRMNCRLLDLDERIGAALVPLTNITSLTLVNVGEAANLIPVLSSMKSPCSHIELEYTRDPTHHASPTAILAVFSESLKILELTYPPRLEVQRVMYPFVTTIKLRNVDWDAEQYNLDPLVRCFPNLSALYIDTDGVIMRSDQEENCRRRNLDVLNRGPWTNLDLFVGSMRTLYLLGIARPIRRCAFIQPLEDEYENLTFNNVAWFTSCMTLVKPTRLVICIGTRDNLMDIFRVVSPVIAAAGVKELKIMLADAEPRQVKPFMIELLEFARAHNLTFLFVILGYSLRPGGRYPRVYQCIEEFQRDPSGPSPEDALHSQAQAGPWSRAVTDNELQALQDVNALRLYWQQFGDPYVIEDIFTSSPHLRYVSFHTGLSSSACLNFCWRAERRNGELIVREAPAYGWLDDI